MADNLTTFLCRLSWNLGGSSFYNPLGLSRTVQGLLTFTFYIMTYVKGKAIPIQDWKGPEGSRRLTLPDFKTVGT
jgi:hypothetical protein